MENLNKPKIADIFSKTATWYWLAFILAGVILAFVSAPIINPDGIEYAVIAHHYADLNFNAAINGIWSPLLSWLLVIPVVIGIDPFLFFRLILVATSLALIVIVRYLMHYWLKPEQRSTDRNITVAAIIFTGLFCLYSIALTPVTSDLFSVLFLSIWILLLSRYHNKPTVKIALLIGLTIGLGYYAKNYFLYFGVATTFLYLLYKFIVSRSYKKIELVTHGSLALLACFLTVLPWIVAMDYKYQKLTLNPIGDYAMSQVGPRYPGPPVLTLGLLEPPYPGSVTAREDPSKFSYIPWGPLDSKSDLKYYLKNILPNNILDGLKILGPVIVLILLTVFSLLHENKKRIKTALLNVKFIGLVVASMVYTGGYCLVHIDGGFRYLWPAYIMLGLAFFFLIPHLNKKLRNYILIFGTTILAFYPIITTAQSAAKSIQSSTAAYQLSQRINETNIRPGSHIASNEPYAAANICYFNGLRCYGLPKKRQIEQQLDKHNIDYIFNFKNRAPLDASGHKVFESSELSILKLPVGSR